jgi:hypothetical protein
MEPTVVNFLRFLITSNTRCGMKVTDISGLLCSVSEKTISRFIKGKTTPEGSSVPDLFQKGTKFIVAAMLDKGYIPALEFASREGIDLFNEIEPASLEMLKPSCLSIIDELLLVFDFSSAERLKEALKAIHDHITTSQQNSAAIFRFFIENMGSFLRSLPVNPMPLLPIASAIFPSPASSSEMQGVFVKKIQEKLERYHPDGVVLYKDKMESTIEILNAREYNETRYKCEEFLIPKDYNFEYYYTRLLEKINPHEPDDDFVSRHYKNLEIIINGSSITNPKSELRITLRAASKSSLTNFKVIYSKQFTNRDDISRDHDLCFKLDADPMLTSAAKRYYQIKIECKFSSSSTFELDRTGYVFRAKYPTIFLEHKHRFGNNDGGWMLNVASFGDFYTPQREHLLVREENFKRNSVQVNTNMNGENYIEMKWIMPGEGYIRRFMGNAPIYCSELNDTAIGRLFPSQKS